MTKKKAPTLKTLTDAAQALAQKPPTPVSEETANYIGQLFSNLNSSKLVLADQYLNSKLQREKVAQALAQIEQQDQQVYLQVQRAFETLKDVVVQKARDLGLEPEKHEYDFVNHVYRLVK